MPTLHAPCNVPSPSTASSASSLLEYYSGAGSPATSVDSHSPGWQCEMSFGAPAVAVSWCSRPSPIDPEDFPWPALGPGIKLRRCEDQDAIAHPATKKVRNQEHYQEISLPSLPNGIFKRKRGEGEEDSIDEALMKSRREEKRPAYNADMQARKDSTEALRRPDIRFAGSSRGHASTHGNRNKFSIREVEGPEQAPSSSSSQIEQVAKAISAPIVADQTTQATKKRFPCMHHDLRTAVELKRHTLTVHGVLARLPRPHCSKPLCGRTDSLSRHLRGRRHRKGRRLRTGCRRSDEA